MFLICKTGKKLLHFHFPYASEKEKYFVQKQFCSMEEYPTHAYAEASFNVEASREKSEDTPLYICSKRGLRKIFVYNERFELPLHLRYHAATGKGFILSFGSLK